MNAIDQACIHFRALLEQQMARIHAMEAATPADFLARKPLRIGLIPGDGIGPIIFESARQVLDILLKDEIASGEVVLVPIDGLTLKNRQAAGQAIPDDVLAQIKTCPALLKGPTTTPQAGTGEKDLESANVAMRRALDLFANVRPVTVPEKGIDWMFFRENTEGEYVLGSKGITLEEGLSCDFKITTVEGTRRIARAAFEHAVRSGKRQVAIVTKANIMKATDGMFTRVCHEVAADYPDLVLSDYYIDIMAANLINPAMQAQFEVFVLPNLYGDIVTDEAAQLQGGVGTAGSANIGAHYAMFEAIHGSAPRMIAEGLGDCANPTSILKATAMLLSHIGRQDAAAKLENALVKTPQTVTGNREGETCRNYTHQLLATLASS